MEQYTENNQRYSFIKEMTVHQYEHQAMATEFIFQFVGEDSAHLEWSARKCFQRIDELELLLSRFIADSDISRINKLKPGQKLAIDFETWEVLKVAIEIHQWTYGAFDIGVGEHMNILRATQQGILNDFEMSKALVIAQKEKEHASIYLDPEQPFFYCVTNGMILDLGGIGKGYALDQISILLTDLGIENYLLSAGKSTVKSKGMFSKEKPWLQTITTKREAIKIQLQDYTISASGSFYQGDHIFDPRTGTNFKNNSLERVWVATKDAAQSDALSTAAYIMEPLQLETLAMNHPEILWIAYSKDGKIQFINSNEVTLYKEST